MKKSSKKIINIAISVLKKIEEAGFQAYIVGGLPRDLELKKVTIDIDVTTNATPKDILEIFKNNHVSNEEYGSITVTIQDIYIEITTFRKELTYKDNRKPVEFIYIDNLEEDLKRRDFIMNTLCIDSSLNTVDYLGARQDIKNRIINTVGNANEKFSQDVLRILRAIRFATVLNFKLSDEVIEAIKLNKYLLKNLSYERKREELDKIFTSPNVEYGVKLILDLELEEVLELPNLKNVHYFKDLLGTWTLLGIGNYPFTKNEKETIEDIQNAFTMDLSDPFTIYHFGPYVSSLVADIKGISRKEIIKRYNHLPITSIKDLEIDGNEIMKILNIDGSPLIKEILNDLEYQVLYSKLKNKKAVLQKYIVKHYKK